MDYRIASARPIAWTVAAALSVLMASAAVAQQPAKPAAKPAPKPAQAQPQQQQQPPQQQQAGQPEVPQLLYSPWMKVCGKGPDAAAKQVCVVAKDGRIENGMPVVAVALIEPEGSPQKILRVTVPPGMHLQHGTRLIVDQGQPATAPYVTCVPNGCMSDYEATADMIGRMKKGQQITVQAINMNGAPISLPLPLVDFAKAYDGPATDEKVFAEQQRKLQEELQKKAEEARKKMEGQQPPAAGAPAAPKQ
ncbi:MAG: invasion associated locus B family protein [Pseudolabrys sp.]